MTPQPTLFESRAHDGQRYAWLIYLIARGGATIHSLFLAVALWLEARPLAWLNTASVLLYLCIATSLRHTRRHRLMACIGVAEIALHAGIATALLGWSSGFHLYLLCLAPIVLLGGTTRTSTRCAFVAALAAGYIGLRYATHVLAPLHAVPPEALRFMEYMNIAGAMALLSVGAHLHHAAFLRDERTLMHLAHTDTLTGLPNRRQWLDAAHDAHRRLRGEGQPYAVLLCDLDHFKTINDRFGHGGGDEALRRLSAMMQMARRGNDIVGRWGGEEFAVLLPGARQSDALCLADALRQRVQGMDLQLGGQPVHLSMTIGVAEARADESPTTLLERADAALYRGKIAGRNRVEQAPHPMAEPA